MRRMVEIWLEGIVVGRLSGVFRRTSNGRRKRKRERDWLEKNASFLSTHNDFSRNQSGRKNIRHLMLKFEGEKQCNSF